MTSLSFIRLSWHSIEGKAKLIAYDLRNYTLVNFLMDYANHLSDKYCYDSKTVRNEIGLLKSMFEFLGSEACLEKVSDRLLVQYREQEFTKTKARGPSRGDDITARRTVNMKLRRVYHFIHWCQETGRLPSGTIGTFNCKVTADFSSSSIRRPGSSSMRHARQRLPALYRKGVTGHGQGPQYSASEADMDALASYFAQSGTPFTFARNVLLMDIAASRGWRRGSINSLLCAQFESDDGKKSTSTIHVTPPSQKFGYANNYAVDFDLATRIRSFIWTIRQPFLEEMGWDEGRAEGRVFISARDGRPLTDQAISRIFGMGFRAIGRPQGAGIHSFRRLFAERAVERELRERLRLGMDTSVASVAASVAVEMGHANPDSLAAYVNRAQSRILGSGSDSGGL